MKGHYDRKGRMRQVLEVDPWALYVAQADAGDYGVVKVGVSMAPVRRAYSIHSNSPFPIERFAWAWAGTKEVAHQLEAFIHRGLKERRLRGEWFRFDFASAEDKRFFNATVQQAYTAMVGRPLKWTGVDLAEIRGYANEKAKERAAGKRQPTVRRFDYSAKSRRP